MQNVKLQIFRVILIFFFNPLVDDLEKCKNVVNKDYRLRFYRLNQEPSHPSISLSLKTS